MKKTIKIFFGILLTMLFISCGSSNESMVEKYLPGTYTRQHKEGDDIGFGYDKEIIIKHLKGDKYRVTCIGNDRHYSSGEIEVLTPDTYDFEISSITLSEKTNSVSKYFVEGIVTNVVEDGTTFSDADDGVNESTILDLVIGENVVEVMLGGSSLSSIRKK